MTNAVTKLALLALVSVPVCSALAQQTKYCGGSLVANSAYSTVQSNGKTADVVYHAQMQNVDEKRRTVTATMLSIQRIGNHTVVQPTTRFDLTPYQQKDLVLFAVLIYNPSGAGAPTPSTVMQSVRFACSFK